MPDLEPNEGAQLGNGPRRYGPSFIDRIRASATAHAIESILAEVQGLITAGKCSEKTLRRCRRAAADRLNIIRSLANDHSWSPRGR